MDGWADRLPIKMVYFTPFSMEFSLLLKFYANSNIFLCKHIDYN